MFGGMWNQVAKIVSVANERVCARALLNWKGCGRRYTVVVETLVPSKGPT